MCVGPISCCPTPAWEGEEELDVVGEEASQPPVYEAERAVALMDEVENHINAHKPGEGNPDWEDQIPKYDRSLYVSQYF